jgi:signal transduction histidine kinase
MGIRRLLFETIILLAFITCLVITANSLQIRHNASEHITKLQEQYFESTYQIYKDEIIGNLLIGDQIIEDALFKEIANRRGVGLGVTSQGVSIQSGNFINQSPVKTYELDLGNNQKAVLSLYQINDAKKPLLLNELILPLLFEVLVLSFGFLYLLRRFNKSLLAPLADLASNLQPGQLELYTPKPSTIYELKELSDTLKLMNVEVQKKAIFEAEAKAAQQVGHDIRSPLACLILLLSQTTGLSEEHRTLMRSAVQRITDITNSLHSKAQKSIDGESNERRIDSYMISSLVDSLVSEKRVHLRDRENVSIDLDLEGSYGLFANLDPIEFKRVLSNLINNSVEAFDNQKHCIHISLNRVDHWIQIQIQDDGRGISTEVLDKVGQYGFSYGKEFIETAGTGLGIHHAIKTIKFFNGTFSINSDINKGTLITIQLPRSETPRWFVKKIILTNIFKIVILDDDQSIFNLWRERLGRVIGNVELIHYSSGNQFRDDFTKKLNLNRDKTLFLMDFELLNQNMTGLDLVEEFDLAKQAVIVTSHYEDLKIRKCASRIGVGIIPKGMAAFVPITNSKIQLIRQS